MKFISRMIGALAIGLCALLASAHAAGLLVPAGGNNSSSLQIKSHDVAVVVENGYAITSVTQVFHNPQANDLEAIYRFPVPDKAAVSEFTVWIDNQPVIGEVLEKEQARKVYEEEKAAGREAGLAEKNKHYSFEIKVTPVRAGQDTKIRLVYMQSVDMDTGIGRYVYPLETGDTDDQANAFWTEQPGVQERFSFDLKLRSSYPVSGMRLPAHPNAAITQTDSQQWQVSMLNTTNASTNLNANAVEDTNTDANTNTIGGSQSHGNLSSNINNEANTINLQSGSADSLDTDIVVYWRLAPDTPASIDMLTHKQADKNSGTFMLTLSPGDDLASLTQGRDWAFVLDTSGSMSGKYATLVDGVQRALGQLNPEDRFRLILFGSGSRELTSGWVSANEVEIRHWSEKLANTNVAGGTNLYAGVAKGLKALDGDRTSAIVLVTDGEANVGITEKKQFLKLMEKRDVRLFTAVMGNGSNRNLLEAMTEVSNGFAINISNSDDIVGKLMEFTSKVNHEAMHDIDLKIRGVTTRDLTPAVTRTLYRGEQLQVFGHYQGSGQAKITLNTKISGTPKIYETTIDFPSQDLRNPEIERLWAYAKIRDMQDLSDYLGDDSEYRSAIIDTAVKYGLVTDQTSMVVMRDEQFQSRNIARNNQARRSTEVAAAQQRSADPVRNTRVDQSSPAFNSKRSSYSSGGSMNAGFLFLMLLLVSLKQRRRAHIVGERDGY